MTLSLPVGGLLRRATSDLLEDGALHARESDGAPDQQAHAT